MLATFSPQPLAHWALSVPRGDPKKTDATDEQLETLSKFKGGGFVNGGCGAVVDWFSHTMPHTDSHSTGAAAESAYQCGVQICFTLVLLLVGLNKP